MPEPPLLGTPVPPEFEPPVVPPVPVALDVPPPETPAPPEAVEEEADPEALDAPDWALVVV